MAYGKRNDTILVYLTLFQRTLFYKDCMHSVSLTNIGLKSVFMAIPGADMIDNLRVPWSLPEQPPKSSKF